jgi:ubiquinone/menaquinone biosynthesis C-methylase UbiE
MKSESVKKSYNSWSATYDSVENKTRDLEKLACRKILSEIPFETVIELGCGTGKNTEWLAEKAKHITAVDLSDEMQAVARQKIKTDNVSFELADIKQPWSFATAKADLITCSLILEHVEDLDFVFAEASRSLNPNGHFYICELHPFKQYGGTKARFETDNGTEVLECFTHNVSNYFNSAKENGFSLARLDEWFDDNDRSKVPRLISFLFEK